MEELAGSLPIYNIELTVSVDVSERQCGDQRVSQNTPVCTRKNLFSAKGPGAGAQEHADGLRSATEMNDSATAAEGRGRNDQIQIPIVVQVGYPEVTRGSEGERRSCRSGDESAVTL